VASGNVITEMTARHRAIEFRRFLARIDQRCLLSWSWG
jgi:hypothetical protein